ncbi:MAG: hypothetical protein H6810_11190 [Phycisphaeraceae bacterium]|nr:MAG: hypothetical protein H6810_11190 [Phycisphaeraceae bacterium]
MHREGADPENMRPEDFLCDFCGQAWRDDRPFVEGHRGSCVCGNCLWIAYAVLAVHRSGEPMGEGAVCAMCLESKADEACWRSPVFEAMLICTRCAKQSAGVLHQDPETDWRKPGAG